MSHDRWERNPITGAKGLGLGVRVVKDGKVKIGGDLYVPMYATSVPALAAYEGKKIEVSVRDAWATEYTARDMTTGVEIATLRGEP